MVPLIQGEIERSFADNSVKLSRAKLVHQFSQDRARIEAQRFGKIDEFNDINSALTDFNAGNDGLRSSQSRRKFSLRKACGFSSGN